VSQGEADKDADSNDDAGDDGRLVSQSQAEDDVSSSTGLARVSHILHKKEPRIRLDTAQHSQEQNKHFTTQSQQSAYQSSDVLHNTELQISITTAQHKAKNQHIHCATQRNTEIRISVDVAGVIHRAKKSARLLQNTEPGISLDAAQSRAKSSIATTRPQV